MEKRIPPEETEKLSALRVSVRELLRVQDYQKCEHLICSAMSQYPHSPEPHNLLGVLFEEKGDHLMAMKHFCAALALDPTYGPAQKNLDCYTDFFSQGECAFYDESDCDKRGSQEAVECDAHGSGR